MTTPDGPAMTPTDLLDRANHLPFSEEERDVLHEALALARETGDEDTEYRARLALTASYRSIDDSPSFLTHFSAAASMHDRDPQRFPGESDGSYPHLFWQYNGNNGYIHRYDNYEGADLRTGVPGPLRRSSICPRAGR